MAIYGNLMQFTTRNHQTYIKKYANKYDEGNKNREQEALGESEQRSLAIMKTSKNIVTPDRLYQ